MKSCEITQHPKKSKTKSYEIDQVIDTFENHYEYLDRWYKE